MNRDRDVFRRTNTVASAKLRFGILSANSTGSCKIFKSDGPKPPFLLHRQGWIRYPIVTECYAIRALDLHNGGWRRDFRWGPCGELFEPLPVEQKTRMIDIE
jgi:hypothetical protein